MPSRKLNLLGHFQRAKLIHRLSAWVAWTELILSWNKKLITTWFWQILPSVQINKGNPVVKWVKREFNNSILRVESRAVIFYTFRSISWYRLNFCDISGLISWIICHTLAKFRTSGFTSVLNFWHFWLESWKISAICSLLPTYLKRHTYCNYGLHIEH